ncbi:MAG: ABC transporter substrate-binding protein [Lachnospiraceae bacterium]
MKKKLLVSIMIMICILSLAACSPEKEDHDSNEEQDKQEVLDDKDAPRTEFTIASMKGPTTMGLVKLMNDVDSGKSRHDYKVSMYGTADEFTAQFIKGDIDIALVPCNLASVLYNKTQGKIQVAAVNTLGVLYMVENGDTIQSVADLKGKTILTTGKGTTPEYVLNYILEKNGLKVGEDVMVEFKNEATEVAAAMEASTEPVIAMLPQPYVTTLQMQMEGVRTALDMTKEWDKVSPDSSLVTGVVVANRSFIEKNPVAFEEFMDDYDDSTEFVNEHSQEAAEWIAGYGIVPKSAIALKALPACNITFMDDKEMKKSVSGYLQVLYDQNPEAVGGVLPDEKFYYMDTEED